MIWGLGFIAFIAVECLARTFMHYGRHDHYFSSMFISAILVGIAGMVIHSNFLQ